MAWLSFIELDKAAVHVREKMDSLLTHRYLLCIDTMLTPAATLAKSGVILFSLPNLYMTWANPFNGCGVQFHLICSLALARSDLQPHGLLSFCAPGFLVVRMIMIYY